MKIIACTGASGSVGKILVNKYSVVPLISDILKQDALREEIASVKPDVIIHLAGMSNVNECETHQKAAMMLNFNGTNNLLASAKDIPVVFLSSDHVFDGKRGNYKEDYRFVVPKYPQYFNVKLPTEKRFEYRSPVNYYGLTKLTCETLQSAHENMKIVRTSYLFSESRLFDKDGNWNFSLLDAPTFLLRSFMYLNHFVDGLYKFSVEFDKMPKILHISGSKIVSWFDLAIAVRSLYGIKYKLDKGKIIPRHREVPSSYAPRPHKAGLNVSLSKKLGFCQFDYLVGLQDMWYGK
jgi:dTDP-4-dehydrorhamnose reductase